MSDFWNKYGKSEKLCGVLFYHSNRRYDCSWEYSRIILSPTLPRSSAASRRSKSKRDLTRQRGINFFTVSNIVVISYLFGEPSPEYCLCNEVEVVSRSNEVTSISALVGSHNAGSASWATVQVSFMGRLAGDSFPGFVWTWAIGVWGRWSGALVPKL